MRDSLKETTQKVEASLLEAIEEHINSKDFAPSDGLDFLDTKNSLLLSYLIDLTVYLRQRLSGDECAPDSNWDRLTEMKTALDRVRSLDKKLRYMIDKLLAAGTTATTFAAGAEDPLQFRPNASALEASKNSDDSSGDDSSGADSNDGQDDNDIDADLAAARMTMAMAKDKKKKRTDNAGEADSGVYKAPRLSAVPYTHDQVDKEAEREKRQRRRMRASELAQTLRSQYGEAPETEDAHGGSDLGKQREATRRMAQKDAERTEYEEDTMIRMTELRKDKKERKRLMREETSNLAAISDLGNLVRDTDEYGDDRDRRKGRDEREKSSDRHANGKRRREFLDGDGKAVSLGSGRKKKAGTKNELQDALFGGGGGGGDEGKKKKKGKGRR